jgi:hypothetical protein
MSVLIFVDAADEQNAGAVFAGGARQFCHRERRRTRREIAVPQDDRFSLRGEITASLP